MELFPKFIIEENDEIGIFMVIGKVTYHNKLVNNPLKVKGGGTFSFNKSTNIIILGGSSFEYGSAFIKHIKECIDDNKVFTNKSLKNSIVGRHTFKYNTGTHIIALN